MGADLRKRVEALIFEGTSRLQQALPFESPPRRQADAALLLLIHPTEVAFPEQAEAILDLVEAKLVRDIGTIRYAGDSYYGQDYPDWFEEGQLAGDFSENIEVRNAKLREGFEAQWCIFDPLLSVIYGKRFLAHPENTGELTRQTHFFNRSLKQLTKGSQCPELYFFRHGEWIPNPHTPLAWTQANLALALDLMKRSATLSQ
jgi:phosphorylase kinase alpha/beta subunit